MSDFRSAVSTDLPSIILPTIDLYIHIKLITIIYTYIRETGKFFPGIDHEGPERGVEV
jgi:hypothetical protein